MEKNSFTSSFKNLPLGLLLSVCLIVIFEAGVFKLPVIWRWFYLYSEPSRDDSLRFEAQLRFMPSRVNQEKVFITGSSQAREDVDVDYLNKTSAGSDVLYCNMGMSGTATPIEMFMIQDKLVEKKPKIVIYMPFVESFYGDYQFLKIKYEFTPRILPYFVEALGVRVLFSHRIALTEAFIGKLFVLYKYRKSIRLISSSIVENIFNVNKPKNPKLFAYVEKKPPSYFTRQIAGNCNNRYRVTKFTDLNKKLFIDFAEKITSKGIKLIVISGPTHPLMKKCYGRNIDKMYNDFLEDQAGRIGIVYYPPDSMPLFNSDEFIDFTHLNKAGRQKFTRFIRDKVLNDI